jgi:hypothetical protein
MQKGQKMAEVKIIPASASLRKIPMRLWPLHPPIFQGGEPTEDDRQLARELFLALDEESQAWYRRGGSRLFDGL